MFSVFRRLHLKLVACTRCGCQIVVAALIAVAVVVAVGAAAVFSFATLWQVVQATHIQ